MICFCTRDLTLSNDDPLIHQVYAEREHARDQMTPLSIRCSLLTSPHTETQRQIDEDTERETHTHTPDNDALIHQVHAVDQPTGLDTLLVCHSCNLVVRRRAS